VKKPLAYHFLL